MDEVPKDFTIVFDRGDCYDGFVGMLYRMADLCVGITLLDGTFISCYVQELQGDEKLKVAPFGKGLEGSSIIVDIPNIKEVRYY